MSSISCAVVLSGFDTVRNYELDIDVDHFQDCVENRLQYIYCSTHLVICSVSIHSTGMCPQWSALVGTDHHSYKITTTTTQQPLQIQLGHTQIRPCIIFLLVSRLNLVSCSHYYFKPGCIPDCVLIHIEYVILAIKTYALEFMVFRYLW